MGRPHTLNRREEKMQKKTIRITGTLKSPEVRGDDLSKEEAARIAQRISKAAIGEVYLPEIMNIAACPSQVRH